jgi:hypothetical protein
MSGLLVKSTAFMKENLQTFNEKGITVPVILGGAALTPKFVNQDCQNTYQGKVIYGKDAFSDLHFMDKLMPAKIGGNWDDLQGFLDEVTENGHELVGKKGGQDAHPTIDNVEIKKEVDTRRSDFVSVDIERPKPPFWGTQFLEPDDISLEELFWYLDLQALVAGQWQFRKPKEQSKEEYQGFLADKVYPVLEVWKGRIIEENLLHPHVIYGYFPCQSVGNSLLIYETNHGGTEDTEGLSLYPDLVILTGPNASGKSCYLRQVGLIQLMAQVGSFVPARSARLGICDRIFTRVGAVDDLATGQSTFMVEMNETANILNHATLKSLVLLDEIGRGTATFDGLSIAWAVAEYLAVEIKSRTIFATHYHELNELATIISNVANYQVTVKELPDQIIFLHQVQPGGADKSYGIEAGRLAGLPTVVIQRAKQVMAQIEKHSKIAVGLRENL